METSGLPPEVRVLQMISSYWASQALATAVRLGVFDALPASVPELALKLDLKEPMLRRLMRACAAVGVLTYRSRDQYELNELGQVLCSRTPHSLGPMAVMLSDPSHWNCWGHLHHSIRTGQTGVRPGLGTERIFDYLQEHPEQGQNFNRAMAAMTELWAEQLGASYDFSPFRTIVDVGGSHGVMLAAALKAGHPEARGILFDLEHVVAEADEDLRRHGIFERTEKVGGSFFDFAPAGDCYLIKHVMHGWPDDRCVQVLSHIRRAMLPQARVLVLEMLLDEEPGIGDLLDLNMMVLNGGAERTAEHIGQLYAAAGLRLQRTIPSVGFYFILEGVAATEVAAP